MKKIYLTGFVVGLLVLVMIRVADAAQSVIGSWTYRAGGLADGQIRATGRLSVTSW